MDGRGTLPRRDLGRSWPITTWQALTFFLASLLVVTNAAWFYRTRVMAVEAAGAVAPVHADESHEVVEYRYAPGALEPMPREPAPTAPLAANERCLAGQRVRKIQNTWTAAGRC